MNYALLSNNELHSLVSSKAADERKITSEVISLLEEVSTRKLYLERGFSSLFSYCVEELRYSESAAYRRISAMRLSKEVPEVRERIEEGTLTLSSVATLQGFFKAEARENDKHYSVEEKRDLLDAIESKSKVETERVLAQVSPVLQIPQEKMRVLSEENAEIRFVADKALLEKLTKLKSLLSHKDHDLNYQRLFHELADLALKKLDLVSKRTSAAEVKRPAKLTRYIPAQTKRDVWKQDDGQCSFVSADGRRCSSRHQLELDHVRPFALGGSSTLENLRLLCRAHNQHRAARTYGSGGSVSCG